MDQKSFIEKHFKLRYCYKYKGQQFEVCKCGNSKHDHSDFPKNEEIWSLNNNTLLKNCDTFGRITFSGYNDLLIDHQPNFIRFNCEDAPQVEEAVYKLLTSYWKFFKPKIVISVNGGFKRMNFNTNQQKKNFKQSLIEVFKNDKTWIIGGGFNVGIHQLISEAVSEYRIQNDNHKHQIKLLGICTWGAILNNKSLSNNDNFSYKYTNKKEKGKVLLDSRYDGFLFCDDGTEKQYDKETNFRLEFEKFVKENDGGYVVQILYEGGARALESAYKSLKESIPLVVIKGSGRAADIISKLFKFSKETYENEIELILKENKMKFRFDNEEIQKFKRFLCNIFDNYRNQVFIHDIQDKSMKLDKKILEAIISSLEGKNLLDTLNLTIKFNCHDIAEKLVFRNPDYQNFKSDVLEESFKSVLEMNRSEFVKLFLENNIDIENFLTERNLEELYKHSLFSNKSRCADLILDLVLSENKSFEQDDKPLLPLISKIIKKLSGNILNDKSHLQTSDSIHYCSNDNESNDFKVSIKSYKKQHRKITVQDLFLWTLLSGHADLSVIFWKIGIDHVGSALIGSIILSKMEILIQKRGYSDTSAKLSEASKKFQDLAIGVIMEAYNNNQEKTYTLLIRTLERWNNMTCLQIAISGNLLEFLNVSACYSYIKKIWMGELSPFLSTWKILITIPFSFFLIKPLIFPSFIESIRKRNSTRGHSNLTPNVYILNQPLLSVTQERITFKKAIVKFYQAPIVKFVVHLVFYLFFLLSFIYLNLIELKDQDLSFKERWAEIFVCTYFFGMILDEIRQVIDQERSGNIHKFEAYLSGSWNIYDLSLLLMFIISIFLRIFLSDSLFIITQCFYSVTLSMLCLRTMQFYFISPSLGPKIIMIRQMIVDIFFFLSIFSLFIISYGTLSAALLTNEKRKLDLSVVAEIFYRPYFQTYGELMLEDLKISNDTFLEPDRTIRYVVIIFGFAIFLLMTHILLINLLIAMFGYTFNKIQVESQKFFSFIQIQLVEEFHEKPLIPPPFNIIYYIVKGTMKICGKCYSAPDENVQNNFLVKSLSKDENIKISAFEQLCMEFSMVDYQSKDTKEISNQNVIGRN